jgi:hypothetical protein
MLLFLPPLLMFPTFLVPAASSVTAAVGDPAVSLVLLLLAYLLLLTLVIFLMFLRNQVKYIDAQFCPLDKEHFCKKFII